MGRSGAAQVIPCEPNTLIGSLGIHFFLQSLCPLALEKSSSCFLNGWSDLGGNLKGTSRATADHLSKVYIPFSGFCVAEFHLSLKKNVIDCKNCSSNSLAVCWYCSHIACRFAASTKGSSVYVMNLTKVTH